MSLEVVSNLLPPIIMGFLLGGLYSVIGFGLSLVFGVMRMVNLAHGSFVIFGSYFAWVLLTTVGLDPLLSLVIILPISFGIGFGLQRALLNRLYRLGVEPPLLTTYGIAIILASAYLLIFTPYSRGLVTSYSIRSAGFGALTFPLIFILDFIAALITMIFLYILLNKTYVGLAIRCATQDPQAAKLVGMNINHIYALTFGLAITFASLGGVFLGLTYPFIPASSFTYLIIAFGVVVVGGLGSMLGTFIGGIVLGLAQTLGYHFFGIGYQLFITYLVILVMLVIRPQGILGVKR